MSVSTETSVSPLAAVASGARLGAGVVVGPFCVVGPEVELGEGTRLDAGAVVTGRTRVGRGCVLHSHCVVGTDAVKGETVLGDLNTVFPGAVVGVECQDLKYDRGTGLYCRLEVGNGNAIRECCTLHLSSRPEWVTRVGDGNLLMAYTHVAHDCRVGDGNVLANGTQLAGHVVMGDRVHTGGGAMVHQFCHVGSMSFLAPGAKVVADVPFGAMVHGDRAALRGLNEVGMQRAGMGRDEISAMRKAFRYLFPKLASLEEGPDGQNSLDLDGRLQNLLDGHVLDAKGARLVDCREVNEFATFIRDSRRGAADGLRRNICMPRNDRQ